MKNKWFLLSLIMVIGVSSVFADDFEDDIYYNPSKSKTLKTSKSNYIKNFELQDVDTYNRRGQYYNTPVDTIGEYIASGEDFVNTQKIQKFYNPTIVVDNQEVLESVLANSYGNVEVIYNIDGPCFSSLYSPWSGYVPASWYNPYVYLNNWGLSVGWNSPYWYGPSWSWSWNWGPTWAYTPVWSWGGYWDYGPGWGYYPPRPPHYRPNPGPRPVYSQWTPGRNLPNRPSGYRNGYNYAGNHGIGRPGTSISRPGTTRPSMRPNSSIRPGQTVRPGGQITRPSRPAGSSIGGNRGSTRRPETTSGSTSHYSTGRSNTTNSGRSSSSYSSPSRQSTTTGRGSSYSSGHSSTTSSGRSSTTSSGRSSGASRSSSSGRGGRR